MDNVLLGRTVDVDLDDYGLRQARAVAQHLSTQQDLLIQASPRQRAQQTAAVIAERMQTTVSTVPEIDEVDFGDWGGRTFTELESDPGWQRWNSQRSDATTPGGDHIRAVQLRLLSHLEYLCAQFSGRCIALVTHAEVIRSAVLYWLEAPVNAYARLEISPASITTVTLGGYGVRIECVNERVRA